MDFPKLNEIVERLVEDYPNSTDSEIQAMAICEIRAESLSIGTSLYIAKIFKHRPEVADACKDNIMSSPEAIRDDIGFASIFGSSPVESPIDYGAIDEILGV